MRPVLFLTSSPRDPANSTLLARHGVSGLPAGMASEWLDLDRLQLPPFQDLRPGCAALSPEAGRALDALRRAEVLVFVSPIYWYAFPAPLHLFLSHMSAWMDDPTTGFQAMMPGKSVALMTARADPAADVPNLAEAMLRRSVEWMGARWQGALHGVGDAPGAIRQSPQWAEAPGFLSAVSCRQHP